MFPAPFYSFSCRCVKFVKSQKLVKGLYIPPGHNIELGGDLTRGKNTILQHIIFNSRRKLYICLKHFFLKLESHDFTRKVLVICFSLKVFIFLCQNCMRIPVIPGIRQNPTFQLSIRILNPAS